MINIIEKENCCGCNACEQVCPKKCICFNIDNEGFKYPFVNKEKCIDCHLCERVCPMLNAAKEVKPISYEAMIFNDLEKRLESSSGGVFTAIAEEIINRNGIVFGASFTDDWHLIHTTAEKKSDLKKFRGSKYLQCDTLNSYSLIKKYLKSDRWVLFSGTPCQVRGLLLYLQKSYKKLVTVDFICHGVPSYDVFKAYLKNEIKNHINNQTSYHTNKINDLKLKDFRFRDKTNGWKNFCLSYTLSDNNSSFISPILVTKSAYMKGYGANLYLRPSCHNCPTKGFKSGSDITLADYWRIEEQHPEMDDDKGTSLVSINTQNGNDLVLSLENIKRVQVDFKTAYKSQTALFHSMPVPKYREEFWNSNWENDFINVVNRIADKKSILKKIILTVKFILRKLGVKNLIKR